MMIRGLGRESIKTAMSCYDTKLYIERIDGCRWFQGVEMLARMLMDLMSVTLTLYSDFD